LSKSFFLAEILPVKIDDFRPNLAGAAHIWPQGFIHIVINVLLLVVFVAVVTVGDRRKERGQLLGPNSYLPLLLATPML
jgi:hypothetical protein